MKNKHLFGKIPLLGDFYFRYIYLYYDEPLIFSCYNNKNEYFLLMREGNDEVSYLVAAISPKMMHMLEKNKIEIRIPFMMSENNCLYRIEEKGRHMSVTSVSPDSVSEEELPLGGEFLDVPSSEELPEIIENKDSRPLTILSSLKNVSSYFFNKADIKVELNMLP